MAGRRAFSLLASSQHLMSVKFCQGVMIGLSGAESMPALICCCRGFICAEVMHYGG